MAFFPQVKKGDKFIPSAELENKVRSFFNGVSTISAGENKISTFNNNVLVAWASKPVPPFTAVKISGTTVLNTNASAEDRSVYFTVLPADASEGIWGICEGGCSEGKDYVTVIMSGFARAFITGSGNYATPGADGKLVAGSSGKALILYKGDEKTPGIVQLGYSGGSVGGGEYQGAFKIVFVGKTSSGNGEFEVINGFDPSSEFCGNTDLPDVASIPRQKFTASKSNSVETIYLSAVYDSSTKKYSASLRTSPLTGAFSNIRVGTIQINSSGEYRINQMLWVPDSGTYFYSRDFYL